MNFDNALVKVADLLQDESVKLLIEQSLDKKGIHVKMLKELISVQYFTPTRKSAYQYRKAFESNATETTATIIYKNKKTEIEALLTQPFITQLKNELKTIKP